MTEYKKIKRNFLIIVVWILFFGFTFCGIIVANERTTYNRTGIESKTIVYNYVTENNKTVT